MGESVNVRGIPHLAKNERDVGHPVIRCGESLLLTHYLSFDYNFGVSSSVVQSSLITDFWLASGA
jgi:hypothetical protein